MHKGCTRGVVRGGEVHTWRKHTREVVAWSLHAESYARRSQIGDYVY